MKAFENHLQRDRCLIAKLTEEVSRSKYDDVAHKHAPISRKNLEMRSLLLIKLQIRWTAFNQFKIPPPINLKSVFYTTIASMEAMWLRR